MSMYEFLKNIWKLLHSARFWSVSISKINYIAQIWYAKSWTSETKNVKKLAVCLTINQIHKKIQKIQLYRTGRLYKVRFTLKSLNFVLKYAYFWNPEHRDFLYPWTSSRFQYYAYPIFYDKNFNSLYWWT